MVNLGYHQFETPKIGRIWTYFDKRTSEHGLLEVRLISYFSVYIDREHLEVNQG
jgi:hypothetical protein